MAKSSPRSLRNGTLDVLQPERRWVVPSAEREKFPALVEYLVGKKVARAVVPHVRWPDDIALDAEQL